MNLDVGFNLRNMKERVCVASATTEFDIYISIVADATRSLIIAFRRLKHLGLI